MSTQPQATEQQAKNGLLSWLGLGPSQETPAVSAAEIVPAAAAPNTSALEAQIAELTAKLADKETRASVNAARDAKLASLEETINSKCPPAARENLMGMAKASLDNEATLAQFEGFLENLPASTWTETPKAGGGTFPNPEQKSNKVKSAEQIGEAAKNIVASANGAARVNSDAVDRSLFTPLGA